MPLFKRQLVPLLTMKKEEGKENFPDAMKCDLLFIHTRELEEKRGLLSMVPRRDARGVRFYDLWEDQLIC